MKRSRALTSLSRDHHQALVIAQKLRRADADGAEEACTAFIAYWSEHGAQHFRLEEELLLPAYAAHGDPHHPLVLQALGDHVAIRQRAARLMSAGEPTPDELRDVGTRLAAHVRLEERELFPMIERAMPPDELLAVARALEGADQTWSNTTSARTRTSSETSTRPA
jgi:hemerythrin-like domain-containing protein